MKQLFILFLLSISFSVLSQTTMIKSIHEKDGKIGIGTSQPDELLTVKGKIHTQEVLVDLEGAVAPDYVFEHYYESVSKLQPAYELPSLQTLEAFVKKNHHLPGIPSAAQLEEQGLSLKEMNLKLLEKIEELTLYTLQQQKEIDILKKQVQNLRQTPQ